MNLGINDIFVLLNLIHEYGILFLILRYFISFRNILSSSI